MIPDWRWLLDREDSPWYPTARLFRQDDTREWDNVIARVHRLPLDVNFVRNLLTLAMANHANSPTIYRRRSTTHFLRIAQESSSKPSKSANKS